MRVKEVGEVRGNNERRSRRNNERGSVRESRGSRVSGRNLRENKGGGNER